MGRQQEYEVIFHLNATARKTIQAETFEQAKKRIESDAFVIPDEIIEFNEPCKVYEIHTTHTSDTGIQEKHSIDYASWGSE